MGVVTISSFASLLLICYVSVVHGQTIVPVRYGYFAEARPFHVACARGWFDLALSPDVYYKVTCYPQSSGRFAAARLDNLQLDMAHLGSTPWAQAAARGVDAKVVFISSYMGTSQGIYVREEKQEIQTPYDLQGQKVGVPFSSTMHYHVLFLLDLLDLVGSVTVVDMSPTEIIAAWDAGEIDVAACWGVAREHVLRVGGARTLVSAGVLSDWGRPTFTSLAVARTFEDEHPRFVEYAVGLIARLTDSFADRLGQDDALNVARWEVSDVNASYVSSLVDVNMVQGVFPDFPSRQLDYDERAVLESFVDKTTMEQLTCQYLNNGCVSIPEPKLATRQTAQFLVEQKVISGLGILDVCEEEVFCGTDMMDGNTLAWARRECQTCNLVGPYANTVDPVANSLGQPDLLLARLEQLDAQAGKGPYVTRADSIEDADRCLNMTRFSSDSVVGGTIGDGANVMEGRSYTEEEHCAWEIIGEFVEVQFLQLRLWSGDFVRIYASPNGVDCPTPSNGVLLGQFTGFWSSTMPPAVYGRGCVLVTFDTDANAERTYGASNGDGFLLQYSFPTSCSTAPSYPGIPSAFDLCMCPPHSNGLNCEKLKDTCSGTTRLQFNGWNVRETLSSQASVVQETFQTNLIWDKKPLSPLLTYPNDLDCRFEIHTPGQGYIRVEIYYDLEPGFDFIYLQTGTGVTAHDNEQPYAVLTGSYKDPDSLFEPELYYIPTDSDGFATLRLQTDAMGRRRGFFAIVESLSLNQYPKDCDDAPDGWSGVGCEFPHCVGQNRLSPFPVDPFITTVGSDFKLGRVISHDVQETALPAMPWAPDGGCVWPLNKIWRVDDVVGLRIMFNSPLDLEPYPASAIGDKVIFRLGDNPDVVLFSERCTNNEFCSYPWQTGICGSNGACEVARTYEIDATESDIAAGTVRLVTDRNDQGKTFNGLDFDLLLVEQCPDESSRVHCENGGGKCNDGFCYCDNGRTPCSCPCEGEASVISTGVKAGAVVGVLFPILFLLLLLFLWYRRGKITKSRLQKSVIKEKEAELEAFRDSVVGMRTAIAEYIPTLKTSSHKPTSDDVIVSLPPPMAPPVQRPVWCWKETPSQMHTHDPVNIHGDPSQCWIKYDDASTVNLETAYESFIKDRSVTSCDLYNGYTVDLNTMFQTKAATGYQRAVQRDIVVTQPEAPQEEAKRQELEVDLDAIDFDNAREPPKEIQEDPQMVLVTGDVIQISKQRPDGWAFGTKLQHADEPLSRQLVQVAIQTSGGALDDALVLTDTGWFELEATRIPSGEDLEKLKSSVGDTGALAPPDTWEVIKDPTIVERHGLAKNCSEEQLVVDDFLSTLKRPKFHSEVKVVKVERIQNLAMWQSYVVKRQTICSRETGNMELETDSIATKRAMMRIERRWLWHATNIEVIDKILQQGFNRSFCGKNATMYGKGVYFARDASYSANRTYAVPDGRGIQYMLACRVVVGEYCLGRRDAVTPDVRDPSKNILYDSTVAVNAGDTMASPSIYVTYHDAQAYPEYLIHFRTL